MLTSGLLQTASTTFFVLAITLTTVANTVVIIAAAPVVAALLARLTIGERSGLRTWVAILAAIGGILIVVSGSLGSGRIEGDLMAVAAIICFSANLILWRRYPDLNRPVAVGLGGLGMTLIALWPADPPAVGARALIILALLGGLVGPAGRVAVASSTRYLAAAQVSLFAPVETVAATGWAWLFLSEPPPARTIVGGIVVVTAVIYGTVLRPAAAAARRTP
jgi:drug/metabolite transporter (DMT)-like permease